MYFRVSNGRYKSRQLPGRGRGPPPLSSTAPSKMPPNFQPTGFAPQEGTKRFGVRGKGVKKRLPKNPVYTVALQRQELPPPPNLPAKATFVSFDKWRRGGGKGMRWEQGGEVTKEGIKKGAGYCIQVSGSHWSAESDPLWSWDSGSVWSGSKPKLLQPRDRGPLENPVSSVRLGAPARLQAGPPAPASLTLCSDSSH